MQKFFKVLRLLVLGFVVLLVVGYLVLNGVALLDVHGNKQDAREEIEQALDDHRATLTSRHEELRGEAGAPEAAWSWQEVVCTWTTEDAGWMVQSYVQECDLQAVDLVPADATSDATCEVVAATSDEESNIGSSIVRGPTEGMVQNRGWEYDCPTDLVLDDHDPARVVLEGERPTELSGEPAWTVLRTTMPLTRTEIGCHQWSVLLCSQPGDVALPEA